MKTVRVSIADYSKVNREFHNHVSDLTDRIFQSESEGAIGYVHTAAVDTCVPDEDQSFPPPIAVPQHFRPISATHFGGMEHAVVTRLAFGPHTVVVLSGEIGSGKTALRKAVLPYFEHPDFHENCSTCRLRPMHPVIINFLSGYDPAQKDQLISVFYTQLYGQLVTRVKKVFLNLPESFTDFSAQASRGGDPWLYADFEPFCRKVLSKPDWDAKYPSHDCKVNAFFSWLECHPCDVYYKIRMLNTILRSVKDKLPCKLACFVCCFDNLDWLPTELQLTIVRQIFALQEVSKVRTLIVVRVPLACRIDDTESFVCDRLSHVGVDPSNICAKRVQHWIDRPHDKIYNGAGDGASTGERQILKSRLTPFLEGRVERREELIISAFRQLSGESIRRALVLASRVCVNTVIRFDDSGEEHTNLVMAMLVGDSKTGIMEHDDQYIANVFVSPQTGAFSLLCLRILMVLRDRSGNRRQSSLALLLTDLGLMGFRDIDEVRVAVNYLMRPFTQLISTSGRATYADSRIFADANSDSVWLTKLGKHYLQSVVSEARYLQEALLAVEWDDAAQLPCKVDYSSIVERFRLLGMQLREVLKQDVREYSVFDRNLTEMQRSKEYNLVLISSRIIAAVAWLVLAVFHSPDRGTGVNNLLRDWQSLVLTAFNEEWRLRRIQNRNLESVIRALKTRLDEDTGAKELSGS